MNPMVFPYPFLHPLLDRGHPRRQQLSCARKQPIAWAFVLAVWPQSGGCKREPEHQSTPGGYGDGEGLGWASFWTSGLPITSRSDPHGPAGTASTPAPKAQVQAAPDAACALSACCSMGRSEVPTPDNRRPTSAVDAARAQSQWRCLSIRLDTASSSPLHPRSFLLAPPYLL